MKLDPAEVFPAVHALALRGSLKHLPGDGRQLEAAGLVCSTPHGFTLTDSGHELVAIVEEVQPTLRRTAGIAPRFGDYIARLRVAERRLLDGELDYAFDPAVESIATVWRELHEDYLQTLGYAQESESI
jgi:hypothetical protein